MNIITFNIKSPTPLTKGRLNRMLKYFTKKKVRIYYEYNDSMGGHQECAWEGRYTSFTIKEHSYGNTHFKEWEVLIFKDESKIFEQDVDENAYFSGLGKIYWYNSGPTCHFEISLK